MPAPFLDRPGIGAKGLGEMIADAGRHQRMRVGYRHQRERTRIGPLLGILGNEARLGLDIVEIFHDRQRLEDGMAVVNESRHHPFGVDGLIARLELLAREDVDRNFLEREALKPERDPDPKRRNRPPKSVDLYAHRKTLQLANVPLRLKTILPVR